MKRLLKADFYHLRKSRLAFIALILALAFPVLVVLLYAGLNAIAGIDEEIPGATLFSANTVMGSAFSLTNNLGLIIPVFAGIIVCLDYSNGTMRNKIIAGNRRTHVYLSHLIISMLFSMAVILIYAIITAVLSLIVFPFTWNEALSLGTEVMYFVLYGLASFAFIATVSTMFALIFRSIAPTII
ncbi:MAG: ABC transporter permease, partial [Clostridia bacterium]|nr:ABC transporter permease [Clostridia bacterium]